MIHHLNHASALIAQGLLSNCWIWARLEYRRRRRAWIASGMPPGQEPYLARRPSRSSPRWLDHHFVGALDLDTDRLALESFKPDRPVDVPWWRAWTRLLFRGRVRSGDFPATQPNVRAAEQAAEQAAEDGAQPVDIDLRWSTPCR